MARQGRFGRSTSGSQNLSSLIYSLLREERNDQEDTMIRSYRNNMRGGVSTNTFSSGGTTISATAASVYQWYLSQADLARQSGDNAGYNSLIQRAEEFRLPHLATKRPCYLAHSTTAPASTSLCSVVLGLEHLSLDSLRPS